MFEVNFINKEGFQHKTAIQTQIVKKEKEKKYDSNTVDVESGNNIKYFYYFSILLIVSFISYVFIKSNNHYKAKYKEINPSYILSTLDTYTESNKIFSINSNSNSFKIIKSISEFSDIYFEQSLLDSLFNTSCYSSSSGIIINIIRFFFFI